ncbi:hypothetical protein NDU88_007704 [Pleurodeles waltl]|uniref:Uncharacterized protein n=1 Tax=Pleurodeles waltl TaxID=8319 RepID=A0AAV7QPW0_PLEWA|nr:hypothetical protein NDU88_007704 [Pleurodeles waltl]
MVGERRSGPGALQLPELAADGLLDTALTAIPAPDRAGVAEEGLPAIACTFTSYYECLYAPVPQPTAERENSIPADIPLPSLPSFLAAELDLPMSEEEVGIAISTFQFGKMAGPDGYPVEYYKQFWSHLIPPLVGEY